MKKRKSVHTKEVAKVTKKTSGKKYSINELIDLGKKYDRINIANTLFDKETNRKQNVPK